MLQLQPTLDQVKKIVSDVKSISEPANLIPLCTSIPADILTPTLAFLKVSARCVFERVPLVPNSDVSS